ncbi:MAG: cysteine hydrolase family protein [Dehalococcoidia bacterium]
MAEAVLIVDMVHDFVHGKLKTDRAQWIIPNIQRLATAARRAGKPVVFVGDAHLPTDPEMAVWGEHAMRGTPEAATISELEPQPGDYVLEKRTYSAFHETGLDMLLRSLSVDTVVICGLHTNICDRHTSADAFHRGYQVVVPEDCVQALSDEEHSSGLEYLRRIYGAEVTSSQALATRWGIPVA